MKGAGRRIGANEAVRLALGGAAVVLACGFALPRMAALPPGTELRAAAFVPVIGAARPDEERAGRQTDGGSGALAATDGRVTVESAVHDIVAPRALPRRAFAFDGNELVWRAVHGAVDGRRFGAGAPPKSPVHGRRLHGIGFPAVGERRAEHAYRSFGLAGFPEASRRDGERVYRTVVAWRDVDGAPNGRQPIPHLRCMGLSPAAVAARASRYEAGIVELAMRHDVSASLVKAVITEESCFDPNARSPVGATGLMQLMPATAEWLGVRDSLDPDANLRGGIRYLAMLLERYGGNDVLALAAYNAGPGNVRRYSGVPPFAETRRYIKRVRAHHRRYVAATALASR